MCDTTTGVVEMLIRSTGITDPEVEVVDLSGVER